jgi:hypothetical protein
MTRLDLATSAAQCAFAAWEQELFASKTRAAFKSLR